MRPARSALHPVADIVVDRRNRTTRKLNSIVVCVCASLATPQAQVSDPVTSQGCEHLAGTEVVRVQGRLLVHTFPGRPNFASVAKGDEAERSYLVKLASPICLDDDGQFAEPSERFGGGSSRPSRGSRSSPWPRTTGWTS